MRMARNTMKSWKVISCVFFSVPGCFYSNTMAGDADSSEEVADSVTEDGQEDTEISWEEIDFYGGPEDIDSEDEPEEDCAGQRACDCLACHRAYSFTCEEILALEQVLDECFTTDDSYVLEGEALCLPYSIGADSRNGLTISFLYFCSDLCPDYGLVYFIYSGVDEEDCERIEGIPLHDPAWGGYIGCKPNEDC